MKAERIYSVEVGVVRCPGDAGASDTRMLVRYCDECRHWGRMGSTHLCGRNWRLRLSELLIELAREGQR